MSPGRPIDAQAAGELFGHMASPQTRPQARTKRSGPIIPRYDRCDACGFIQPCLLTFQTVYDWEADFGPDHPVRAFVTRTKKSTGRFSILVCDRCVTTMATEQPESAVPINQLPGVWD